MNRDRFKARRSRGSRRQFPRERLHRFKHMMDDPSYEAKSKAEKNFTRKYARSKKQEILHIYEYKCYDCDCGHRFLHIHHLKYTTCMKDWVPLCKKCHDKRHGRS